MLVLTRKRTEVICIGENIRIKVIRCGKGAVKLGIEAPDDVRVLRAELCFDAAPVEAVVGDSSEEDPDGSEEDALDGELRIPEVDAEDLAQFAALVYPQAV